MIRKLKIHGRERMTDRSLRRQEGWFRTYSRRLTSGQAKDPTLHTLQCKEGKKDGWACAYINVEAESAGAASDTRPHWQIQCSISVHILFELSVALNTISWKHFFLGFDDTLLLVFLPPHWQFLVSLPWWAFPPHQNSKCWRAPETGPGLHSLSYLRVFPG